MARVCLAMIVRDAESIVERAIRSALPMVDRYLIIDTGSEDDTIAKIESVTSRVGLRGMLLRREWVSHAHNRSELLEEARQFQVEADKQGRPYVDPKDGMPLFDYQPEYVLMMDADMELVIEGDVPELTADEYMIPIRDRGLVYPLPLLTSTRKRFRYEGVTHAYLVCDDGPTDGILLQTVALLDHGGGGGRPGKIERDVELLAAEVAKNPQDARSWFYLAQSYRDLDRHQEAITAYRMRASLGGWSEEVYNSLYQAGMLLSAHVNFFDGAQLLLEAAKLKPNRAEALRGLAGCAESVANKIPFPDTEVLFVEPGAYTKRPPAPTPVAAIQQKPLPPLPSLEPRTRKGTRQRDLAYRDVTAIIVTRGDVSLEPILSTLPYDDVVVWDNSKREHDYRVFGRYAAIQEVDTPLVYWQDDDVIFTAHDLLLAHGSPQSVVCNMDYAWLAGAGYIDTQLGLMGAGSLCPAAFPQAIFDWYFRHHPWDQEVLDECDFLFGTLAPTVRVDLGYEVRSFADDPNRLYLQPGQTERKWAMIERCTKMLRERSAA